MPRLDALFKIPKKIGLNAYKVELPSVYEVSTTFNVADLSPDYDETDKIQSLRINSNQVGGMMGDCPL